MTGPTLGKRLQGTPAWRAERLGRIDLGPPAEPLGIEAAAPMRGAVTDGLRDGSPGDGPAPAVARSRAGAEVRSAVPGVTAGILAERRAGGAQGRAVPGGLRLPDRKPSRSRATQR
jgi:hypothetical protein